MIPGASLLAATVRRQSRGNSRAQADPLLHSREEDLGLEVDELRLVVVEDTHVRQALRHVELRAVGVGVGLAGWVFLVGDRR